MAHAVTSPLQRMFHCTHARQDVSDRPRLLLPVLRLIAQRQLSSSSIFLAGPSVNFPQPAGQPFAFLPAETPPVQFFAQKITLT